MLLLRILLLIEHWLDLAACLLVAEESLDRTANQILSGLLFVLRVHVELILPSHSLLLLLLIEEGGLLLLLRLLALGSLLEESILVLPLVLLDVGKQASSLLRLALKYALLSRLLSSERRGTLLFLLLASCIGEQSAASLVCK